jgi:hypothetical protein
MKFLSWRRLSALCLKETRQILRDPSSGVIAFILPMILLVIYGYGLNLDAARLRMGLCDEDGGPVAASFTAKLTGSTYFEIFPGSRAELDVLLETGGYGATRSWLRTSPASWMAAEKQPPFRSSPMEPNRTRQTSSRPS